MRAGRHPMGSSIRISLGTIVAMTLAMIGGSAQAQAQCTGQCAEQALLLAPFNALLSSPAGIAVLDANLQTENNIYLGSTQAQKIAAGTALIIQVLPANVLLRA